MNSHIKRLLLAAGLSGLGVAATFIWYRSTDSANLSTLEAPLAQVGNVSEEVLRRPPTRLLWHSVNTGDPLFNGEAIRTSANGEVRIQFEDGRYIDLEADSLIVLTKAQGEISLDLMEGSLFVNAKSSDQSIEKSNLVLNSAQGKVDLSQASATLSKTEGQKLNLQVLEGSAKIKSTTGETQELQQGKTGTLGSTGIQFDSTQLEIISPLPNKSIFVDPSKRPDVAFRWKGFPAGWKVTLLLGSNRKQMKMISETLPGLTQSLTPVPIGRHYWKLRAINPENPSQSVDSQIYRLDVQARQTPNPIFPAPLAQLEFENVPTDIKLQWEKSEEIQKTIVEVATDPQLKNKVKVQTLESGNEFLLSGLSPQDYYWRLSTFYSNDTQPWSGPIYKFSVLKKAEVPVVTVNVAWENTALQQYFIDNPNLKLAWTAGEKSKEVAQWKVTWKNTSDPGLEPGRIETVEKSLSTPLTKPGRYLASVEAYDKKGRLMGASPGLEVQIQTQPLIPSPQLLPPDGPIKASSDGRGELTWSSIEGAKEYEVKVFNKDKKEIFSRKVQNTKTVLVNLMPGEYSVEIVSIDEFNRTSPSSGTRTLIVPDKSNLRAPALKKVKVN
ncbi:MAG: FecR domain-containing protein [Bdellovibrionales bacterium]